MQVLDTFFCGVKMGQLKCENCGIEIYWKNKEERKQVAGWVGIGLKSKYGKQFDKQGGRAWYCPMPICQTAKSEATLRLAFPTLSDEQRQMLLEEAELSRLRQN